MHMISLAAAAVAAVTLAGCASMGGTASRGAPEPAKRIEAARLYTGTWLEVARTPMWLTDGCVAGTTAYTRTAAGVAVRDACREGNRAGREKSIEGEGTILDPGTDAKLRVRYNALITWDYWILDRADDYSWFISTSPNLDKAFIFTRRVPTKAQLDRLTARLRQLGYAGQLEFPEQPPS